LAGRVLLKIVYVLTCRVLGMAVLVFRGDPARDVELLVLARECGAAPARRPDAVQVGRPDMRRFRPVGVVGAVPNPSGRSGAGSCRWMQYQVKG
jgi:hypothetical protein